MIAVKVLYQLVQIVQSQVYLAVFQAPYVLLSTSSKLANC